MQYQNLDIPADVTATLIDPRAYADDRIHDAYRWLRANNPLGIARPEGYDPFWVVTKHADILNVSRQNDLFHNADRPTTLTTKQLEERARKTHRQAQPGALAGADGRAGSSKIPRADAGLVHAGEPDQVRGAGSQHREAAVEKMLALRRPLRFRHRRRAWLSPARHHGNPRRAGERRAAHAEADAGAVRRRRTPTCRGRARH